MVVVRAADGYPPASAAPLSPIPRTVFFMTSHPRIVIRNTSRSVFESRRYDRPYLSPESSPLVRRHVACRSPARRRGCDCSAQPAIRRRMALSRGARCNGIASRCSRVLATARRGSRGRDQLIDMIWPDAESRAWTASAVRLHLPDQSRAWYDDAAMRGDNVELDPRSGLE